MSFILDALKKSENARQRQAGPALFEVKVGAPKRGPPTWAVLIGALLLINAAVLAWVLLRRPTPPAGAARAAAPSSPTPSPPGAPALRSVPDRGSVPPRPAAASPSSSDTNTPVATAQSAIRSATLSAPPAARPDEDTAEPALPADAAAGPDAASTDTNPADFAPAAQPPGPATQRSGASLPLYEDLASAPGVSLPPLHLDLHVYDPDPRKRYVMINTRMLRQGDSLPDGVTVVSIRPDGVVLSFEGRRFLLPR